MTTNTSITETKNSINGSLLTGILLVVLGIAGIAVPAVSTIVAETWLAIILTSAGVTKLVYTFQTRNDDGFIWKLLLSILYIATGVVLFFYPLTGVLTLTLLLGSFLLTEGVFELILSFKLKGQPNSPWVLTNAIMTLLLGVIVWLQWPSDAPWLIGTLVGASVLFTGVSRVMLSVKARSALPTSQPTTTTT